MDTLPHEPVRANHDTTDPAPDDGRCAAVCRECTAHRGHVAVSPFNDAASRQRWISVHPSTHDVRRVDGWPTPERAWAETFGGQA